MVAGATYRTHTFWFRSIAALLALSIAVPASSFSHQAPSRGLASLTSRATDIHKAVQVYYCRAIFDKELQETMQQAENEAKLAQQDEASDADSTAAAELAPKTEAQVHQQKTAPEADDNLPLLDSVVTDIAEIKSLTAANTQGLTAAYCEQIVSKENREKPLPEITYILAQLIAQERPAIFNVVIATMLSDYEHARRSTAAPVCPSRPNELRLAIGNLLKEIRGNISKELDGQEKVASSLAPALIFGAGVLAIFSTFLVGGFGIRATQGVEKMAINARKIWRARAAINQIESIREAEKSLESTLKQLEKAPEAVPELTAPNTPSKLKVAGFWAKRVLTNDRRFSVINTLRGGQNTAVGKTTTAVRVSAMTAGGIAALARQYLFSHRVDPIALLSIKQRDLAEYELLPLVTEHADKLLNISLEGRDDPSKQFVEVLGHLDDIRKIAEDTQLLQKTGPEALWDLPIFDQITVAETISDRLLPQPARDCEGFVETLAMYKTKSSTGFSATVKVNPTKLDGRINAVGYIYRCTGTGCDTGWHIQKLTLVSPEHYLLKVPVNAGKTDNRSFEGAIYIHTNSNTYYWITAGKAPGTYVRFSAELWENLAAMGLRKSAVPTLSSSALKHLNPESCH